MAFVLAQLAEYWNLNKAIGRYKLRKVAKAVCEKDKQKRIKGSK